MDIESIKKIKDQIAKIVAENQDRYHLTGPEVVRTCVNEEMKTVIRPKRRLAQKPEEIYKKVSAIPNYIKNIINNVAKYIKRHKKYPTTTQVHNFYFARKNYNDYTEEQKIHYDVLPEWKTYLSLFDYYDSNKVMYKCRDYSLDNIRKFKERGPEMFELQKPKIKYVPAESEYDIMKDPTFMDFWPDQK